MAIAIELSPGITIKIGNYSSQSAGSSGVLDLSASLTSSNAIPLETLGKVNTTFNTTKPLNTYYKIEGFNEITQSFETWHCQNVIQIVPPSGNILVNVSVIAIWQDR